jgi:MFS family permease
MTVSEKAALEARAGQRTGPYFFKPSFWTVMTAQVAFGLGWSSYLILPKYLATELGADAEAIGYVSAMSGFAAVLTIPLVTSIIDRVGRRLPLQLGCALLIALSLTFLAVDRVGPLVYLLSGATGASFVLAFNASATLVTDAAPASRLGQAIGILGAANMSTNAIATLAAERIALSSGWPRVFELAAAMGVIALALTLTIREAPRPRGSARSRHPQDVRARGSVVRVLAVSALAGAPFAAMFTFHQPYALALGAPQLAAFFIGFTASAMLVRIFFGTLGDRFGRRRLSVLAMLGYGVVALATAELQVEWLWAYGSAFGFAHGVLYPTLNALAVELAPPEARGRVITLFNGAFNAGYGVSTLGWGNIAARWGFPAVFWVAAVLSVGAAALLAFDRGRSREG